MTTEELDNLFNETLLGDYDDDAPWNAVAQLRLSGDRYVFERAAEWCTSSEPMRRARGAAILCQLRSRTSPDPNSAPSTEPVFVDESLRILLRMIEVEVDETALGSVIAGLGHLNREEAIPIVDKYANHANENIRWDVASALGHFPDNPMAVVSLIALADDPNGDVRNWSLFGLGTQSDIDSDEVRALFVRHLDDPHEEARQEAIAGLAKRKDRRAAPPLLRLLQSGSYSAHHEDDFKSLLDLPDDADSGTEDLIDALYEKFPDLHSNPTNIRP